jgi:hypothetical protein
MSNERRNPYYKKKNHKNTSSVATAAVVTRAGAARMNKTNKRATTEMDAERTLGNKMNVSIEYNATAGLNNLNESMISTASSVNPQDLDQITMQGSHATALTTIRNPTYITNLEATMDHTQRTTNTMNTQSLSSTATGRVLLVNRENLRNAKLGNFALY